MEQNFVSVPYEEFQILTYRASIYSIINDILTHTDDPYIDVNTLRIVYGLHKLDYGKKEA